MNLTETLRQGYAPGVPYYTDSGSTLICDFLLETAKHYPRRVALDFLSQQTTYEDLVMQVRQAATVLRNSGVKEGDHIALIMPNCPQHVVAVMAIAMVGAISIEHNPLAPEAELQAEFARHRAKTVIAWENTVEKLSFLGPDARVFGVNLAYAMSRTTRMLLRIPVKSVQTKRRMLGAPVPDHVRSWDRIVREATPWMGDPTVSPEAPAVMLHTSGTTGTPKAAVLTHKNLSSNVVMAGGWVPSLRQGAEVFYSILPFFHAYGFTITMLAGLYMGATIAIFPKFDVSQVLLAQKRLPCTFFVGVPPMFDRLLAEAPHYNSDLTSISYTISGAMPLSEELSARWEAATGGYVIEGYGMTEASPIILGSPLSHNRRPGALGLPWPSTEVRIVDPEDPTKDTPIGEVGELIARGPQVFKGYLDDPEETALALQDGWLFTGDLVQVRDGFIYMEDRRKELILSGGFNVYPSQVEDVVRMMPGVEDVAVVGMPGGSRGEEVVAALVLEGGASVTLADVREWAEKSLAHYALPRQIVVVQELPKSQIGKVMRRSVQKQIAELQEGLETRFPTLASSAAEIGEQVGHAAAAVKESVSQASEKAAALIARASEAAAQKERNEDEAVPVDSADQTPEGDEAN
ncbi:AMP-binding protein [Actinomyces minihominis]|uniref:AMP-binding protein n=1 Tax=Actinomyces minihominis TaxID=2002838 RepID=UPI000C085017|nr:AMP-binding protein [Actinomyces minihominis]